MCSTAARREQPKRLVMNLLDFAHHSKMKAFLQPNLDDGQYQLLLPTRVALLRRTDVRRYKAIK